MRCSCTTENKRHCDFKKLRKRLLTIKTRNIIRWNIYRDNNCYSRRQVLRVKCFWKSWRSYKKPCRYKPAFRCLQLFQDELEARVSLKAFLFTTNILQNVFPLFVVRKCVKAFKVLYIKPGMMLGQFIVSNLKNLPQKTTLDFMKLSGKKTSNAIITQAYQSRCSSWRPSSKARIASDFSTLLRIQQG